MLRHPDDVHCLRDVLELLRPRPAMYLSEKSLTLLIPYMHGYEMACRVHSINDDSSSFSLKYDSKFLDWVTRKMGLGRGGLHPLHQLIDRVGDDALAFDRFFELLDEYEEDNRNKP